MPLAEYEKTLTCPYNPAHQILPERMHCHLTKCRKQHSWMKLQICPFHWCHHIPKAEYKKHVATCKFRMPLELELYRAPDDFVAPKAAITHGRDHRHDGATGYVEDWDSQQVSTTYDPLAKCAERKIIRNPPRGSTKRELRRFRDEEILRHEKLRQEQEATVKKTSGDKGGATKEHGDVIRTLREDFRRLRLPRDDDLRQVSSKALEPTQSPLPAEMNDMTAPATSASFTSNETEMGISANIKALRKWRQSQKSQIEPKSPALERKLMNSLKVRD